VVGLDKKDYRVKDGGLEMRVQNGDKKDRAMLKVILPFTVEDSVIVSVKVTPLDAFTADKEFAGVFLLTDGSWEFAAKKQLVKDTLVFAPGKYVFKGKKGEEGDVSKYEVNYTSAAKDVRPLRITVHRGTAFFSAGPSDKDEYRPFFQSALGQKAKEHGFGLMAAGAPDKAEHWVRFTGFKVVKR
jgi:regulation of enolase protein 1 (concanavalin A-like superfamily)